MFWSDESVKLYNECMEKNKYLTIKTLYEHGLINETGVTAATFKAIKDDEYDIISIFLDNERNINRAAIFCKMEDRQDLADRIINEKGADRDLIEREFNEWKKKQEPQRPAKFIK